LEFDDVFSNINLIDIEDLKNELSKAEMISNFMMVKCLPASLLKWLFCRGGSSSETAAILFSSGSEGLPKGVELSHQNIISNLKQVAEVLNADDGDVIMSSLPSFHAFGLTVTQFMPLIEGLPMVCHADPTDSFGVAKAIAKYRATIMCGTSTFLRFYARDSKVKPLMFDSLRVVVSGAEKLNDDVRTAFKMKFGKDVYEGYGATETAPVASVNLPDILDTSSWKIQPGSKNGTVGMPLPGTSFKVVDPNTLDEIETGEQGMILIGGPQVMKGYLNNPEKTATVIKTSDGIRWYETGDKGYLDADGFLTIVDRYSRFAKVAGEMVSLGEVEESVRSALKLAGKSDDVDVVAVAAADDKKGEKIILLSSGEIELKELREGMLSIKANPLHIPATVLLEQVPKLGSGKTDYASAKAIVLEELNS